MPLSTYEEAGLCPTCQEPGRLLNNRRATSPDAPRGTRIHTFECHNDRCADYFPAESLLNGGRMPAQRNRWAVQVSPDGTVPPKGSGAVGPKAFERMDHHSSVAQRARDQLRLAAAQDEMNPGGQATEIQNDLRYRGGY